MGSGEVVAVECDCQRDEFFQIFTFDAFLIAGCTWDYVCKSFSKAFCHSCQSLCCNLISLAFRYLDNLFLPRRSNTSANFLNSSAVLLPVV